MIKQCKFEWGDKSIPFLKVKQDGTITGKEQSMVIEPVKYARQLTYWENYLEAKGIPYAVYLVENSYKEEGIVKSEYGFTIIINTEKHSVNFTDDYQATKGV